MHSADFNAGKVLSLANLKAAFSDSDVKVEYFDDGRLKSFNATSTGQGEAILKTVVSIFDAALGFSASQTRQPGVCASIRSATGDKPLTLTYSGTVDPGVSNDQLLAADPATAVLVSSMSLEPLIGHICAAALSTTQPDGRAVYVQANRSKRELALSVREPAQVAFSVSAGNGNACDANKIWQGTLPVAHKGKDYDLPLQRPSLFGKGVLAANFNDAGGLTMIQFVANTGAGQALNVLSAAQSAAAGSSTSEKAALVKAEADLIAQQQRLLQCRADPTNCK